MAWRYQRRKQLLPGVRANIGKRGLSSLSFGGRGARVSVGQRGTQGTLTALGTGLSYIFRRDRRR
jgi:hypothetical protein